LRNRRAANGQKQAFGRRKKTATRVGLY